MPIGTRTEGNGADNRHRREHTPAAKTPGAHGLSGKDRNRSPGATGGTSGHVGSSESTLRAQGMMPESKKKS